MRVIRKDFYNAADLRLKLYPLGDMHIGSASCDEDAIARAVAHIAADPDAYWVGMGDYLDAINRRDRRFDPTALAPWITAPDLADLGRAQLDRFLTLIEPIAHKCLGLLLGNHEEVLTNVYEHDIYGTLIREVKRLGGMDADTPLRLGYTGYLQMSFLKGDDKKSGSRLITANLHHGAGGGRTGATINKMEDWLLSHECDFCVIGHTHKLATTAVAVESVTPRSMRIQSYYRHGVVASTFMQGYQEGNDGSYAERKMMRPLPMGRSEIQLWPHAPEHEPQVKVSMW